ncbi:MAG: C40 family peptidase [Erythrobacter sp.]|nr:MAG: C40 family peptidase [Erythrobacter sp.]
MNAHSRALADAARALLGTPFRLYGRDPASGVDCIGLVACSLVACGQEVPEIPRYALRNLSLSPFLGLLAEAGFAPVTTQVQPGDLLLLKPSPGQFHLAIAVDGRAIAHAHAGLGRVVLSPLPAPHCISGRWRLT